MARLNGTPGNDVIIGTRQADVINGRGGNDRIVLRDGADRVTVGPNDVETLITSGRGNARIDLSGATSAPTSFVALDYRIANGIEATLGPRSGTVKKTLGNSTDTIVGYGTGTHPLSLGIWGSAGNDVIRINREGFQFTQIFLGAGADLVIGEGGFTRVGWLSDLGGIEATVTRSVDGKMTGSALDFTGSRDRFRDIDELSGTNHDDRLIGSSGSDRFIVTRGDDFVDGRGGTDLMNYQRGTMRSVDVDLAQNRAVKTMDWFGQEVDFRDTLRSIENVRGSNGNDVIRGDNKANLLDGRGGNDVLLGRGGNDVLIATSGNNRLDGGGGNDRLIAGGGQDVLIGGAGADVFVFRDNPGVNVIKDFGRGNNRIDFSEHSGINRFADIRRDISQDRSDAVIDLGSGEIRLENYRAADLSAGDFIF